MLKNIVLFARIMRKLYLCNNKKRQKVKDCIKKDNITGVTKVKDCKDNTKRKVKF